MMDSKSAMDEAMLRKKKHLGLTIIIGEPEEVPGLQDEGDDMAMANKGQLAMKPGMPKEMMMEEHPDEEQDKALIKEELMKSGLPIAKGMNKAAMAKQMMKK